MRIRIELTIWAVDIVVYHYNGVFIIKFSISFIRLKETWQRVRRLFKTTQSAS